MNSFISSSPKCICEEEGLITPISHFEVCKRNYEAIYDQSPAKAEKYDRQKESSLFNKLSNIWGTGSLAGAGHSSNFSFANMEATQAKYSVAPTARYLHQTGPQPSKRISFYDLLSTDVSQQEAKTSLQTPLKGWMTDKTAGLRRLDFSAGRKILALLVAVSMVIIGSSLWVLDPGKPSINPEDTASVSGEQPTVITAYASNTGETPCSACNDGTKNESNTVSSQQQVKPSSGNSQKPIEQPVSNNFPGSAPINTPSTPSQPVNSPVPAQPTPPSPAPTAEQPASSDNSILSIPVTLLTSLLSSL